MSFLVLVLIDFLQKALANRIATQHPMRSQYKLVYYKSRFQQDVAAPAGPSDAVNALSPRSRDAAAAAEKEVALRDEEERRWAEVAALAAMPAAALPAADGGDGLEDATRELAGDMPIVEAFARHVEPYIYSHPKAK